MSTSLRRRHRDRVVRRGIGLTIESDFYATEAGRAHFADQLTVSQSQLLSSALSRPYICSRCVAEHPLLRAGDLQLCESDASSN